MTLQDTTSSRQILANGAIGHIAFEAARQPLSPEITEGSGEFQATVLVVDDERYIVDFVGILLEEEGYRVARAYDGQQAWELTCSLRPDLIISDVMMPKMNGLELVRRIRESHDVPDMPVILMSAVTKLDSNWIEGVSFLPKPFDIDQMLDLVTNELQPEANVAD